MTREYTLIELDPANAAEIFAHVLRFDARDLADARRLDLATAMLGLADRLQACSDSDALDALLLEIAEMATICRPYLTRLHGVAP